MRPLARRIRSSSPTGLGSGEGSSDASPAGGESIRELELSTALQLAALVESSDDAVIVLSLDGLVATWSKGAERLFGYSQKEVVGQRMSMLAPPGRREEAELLVGRILAGGGVERIHTECVANDGRLLTVSLVISAINGTSGRIVGVAAIVRDTSAHSATQVELQASDELYRSVVDALHDGVVLQDATGRILAVNESAARIMGRPASELLGRHAPVAGSSEESIVRLIHEDGSPFRHDDRPEIVSVRTGEPQLGVVMGAERVDGSTSWLSINSTPLEHPHEQRPFAAVSSISDITSLRTTLAELQAARFEDLERLALAAEYRDDDTQKHTERVAILAESLARELAMDDELIVTMRRAAPLHDIGKIGIPDRILLKPGRLTAGELEQMQTHTTIGAHILGDSDDPILRMGRQIALTHHERWDGTGYPAGLRGEAIPACGRIVAVADVFDAITHARPYKPALSAEYAIAEIKQASGTQFEAKVVDAFLACGQGSPPARTVDV
jgi:putative two-component system response regulator